MSKDRFLQLLQPIYPNLERYVLFLCKDRELARDVIGDTIEIAFTQRSTIKSDKAFLSYLFTIALRTYSKVAKAQKINKDIDLDALFASQISSERLTDYHLILEALESIGDIQKQLMLLFYTEGFSLTECAEILDISHDNARQILHRTRTKLREILSIDLKEQK